MRSARRLGCLAARARTELARVAAAQDRPRGNGDRDGGNVFRRDGDAWTARLRWPHRAAARRERACADLAVLLAAPGREVAATELARRRYRRRSCRWLAGLGADPVLDDRAGPPTGPGWPGSMSELAEADTHHDIERSARLAAERDALIGELAQRRAAWAGGARRLGTPPSERRTTVTARIRDAIGRIERAHPELGRHLRASIVTGARCAYRPAETVRWSISQS